uniref:Uncharacterized protein n=1 Tax=Tetraselmis sp. GSL018 TaxID=582737 RepID=A0A061SL70_9CHLO
MERPTRLRSLLLRYMLYESVLKPSTWSHALFNDRERTTAWIRFCLEELRKTQFWCREAPKTLIFLGSSGRDYPVVPLATAKVLKDGLAHENFRVVFVEAVKPVAAAVQNCLSDSGLSDICTVTRDTQEATGMNGENRTPWSFENLLNSIAYQWKSFLLYDIVSIPQR